MLCRVLRVSDDFVPVPEQHHRLIHIEQFVVETA